MQYLRYEDRYSSRRDLDVSALGERCWPADAGTGRGLLDREVSVSDGRILLLTVGASWLFSLEWKGWMESVINHLCLFERYLC